MIVHLADYLFIYETSRLAALVGIIMMYVIQYRATRYRQTLCNFNLEESTPTFVQRPSYTY